jgi:glyoxylase-like metal-dependent hydrolase (beta-lactamase superfamily II)
MEKWQYTRGLHQIGNNVFAYLQPPVKNQSWGWSNAGYITGNDGIERVSTLVDTLYDVDLTQEMHDTMCRFVPEAKHIDIVVNTHSNGDHCNGNQLFRDARIITSASAADEMMHEPPPQVMANMLKNAPEGAMIRQILGPFNFASVTVPPRATETFEVWKTLYVGDKVVELLELGPAHSNGDTVVYIPADRIIFTGDILFIGSHPVVWAGPISNWLRACNFILSLDVDVIVPGHGPITDKHGVQEVKDYLQYVYAEARKRFEAGMPALDAARDIALDGYASWLNGERIIPNVDAVYRELRHTKEPVQMHQLFAEMARFVQKDSK